ncbi:MAG: aspartate kinase, partial [Bacteroidota bacterium]
MKVLKFGGTSVGSVEAIKQVASIVKQGADDGQQQVVVVSAFSGVTNELEELARLASSGDKAYLEVLEKLAAKHYQVYDTLTPGADRQFLDENIALLTDVLQGIYLLKELTAKSDAYVMSFGERMSSYIIAEYFNTLVETKRFDSRDYLIVNQDVSVTAIDHKRSIQRIGAIDSFAQVNVFPGFIASTTEGITTTLGRGGSDYSAALFANLFNATELEIWTDVSGLLSADPNLVKQARVIEHLSYEEAMELSHFGAKVIYPPSIQPALSKGIPILIKNT